MTRTGQLPRALHPGAWWLWAIGLAVVAGRTTNPLLLALLLVVVGHVVVRRRTDAPWALSFRMYLIFGAVIVVLRVAFRIVLGGGQGEHILFTLPEIPLPDAAAGIRLFGPVAAEEILGGLYDGLQLATMVVCVGAANVLANPKRMLKAMPGALHEIGTSVVVALTVAPQLIESVQRVRRARRLRGARERGRRALRGILIPVLEDALARSLALAAAMASRGYGRTGPATGRARLTVGTLVIGGLLGIAVGLYGILDTGAPGYLGPPMLLTGTAVAMLGFALGGRGVRRTGYRPDHWRTGELLTVAAGLTAAALMHTASRTDSAVLFPALSPLSWPDVTLLPLLAVLAGLLPAYLSPPPPPTPAAGPPTPASAPDTAAPAAHPQHKEAAA
ncbi:CbiQ family ECF transporter T component [Streptomyces avicenniae]|uniref:CbiQ family ECF transporter T component n=1 Tax=Streptomyces avicenniae TaxID=500153 RepID=UPI000A99E23D|nr:CbiQ family ECF transporter T component [Streptomyces avicenniae]